MDHVNIETRDAATVEELWQTVVPGARIARAETIQPALSWHAVSDGSFGFCDYTIGSTMLVDWVHAGAVGVVAAVLAGDGVGYAVGTGGAFSVRLVRECVLAADPVAGVVSG